MGSVRKADEGRVNGRFRGMERKLIVCLKEKGGVCVEWRLSIGNSGGSSLVLCLYCH